MDWLYYLILLALLVCGLAIILMNFPGLWLMAAAAGLYSLITPEHYLWPWGIVTVLAFCALGEVMELIVRAGGAKKAGGSSRAMWLGLLGGLLGGILLSIPVPIIGTVAGVCIGAFAGAMIGQLTVASDVEHSARVGFGAAKGTLLGILVKLCIGLVLLIVVAVKAFPAGGSRHVPAPISPTSTTLPATMQSS
jgi:uncharacterized protein YqgC (DUF456 family)